DVEGLLLVRVGGIVLEVELVLGRVGAGQGGRRRRVARGGVEVARGRVVERVARVAADVVLADQDRRVLGVGERADHRLAGRDVDRRVVAGDRAGRAGLTAGAADVGQVVAGRLARGVLGDRVAGGDRLGAGVRLDVEGLLLVRVGGVVLEVELVLGRVGAGQGGRRRRVARGGVEVA